MVEQDEDLQRFLSSGKKTKQKNSNSVLKVIMMCIVMCMMILSACCITLNLYLTGFEIIIFVSCCFQLHNYFHHSKEMTK